MSFFTDASFVMDPNVYGVGKLYVPKPTDGSGDLTFSRASTGTRVNQDGLIEKVRTNLILQSNSFDTSWGVGGTLVGGQADKDGGTSAWSFTSSSPTSGLNQSITTGGVQTFSAYIKKNATNGVRIYMFGTLNASPFFNLDTGSVVSLNGAVDATIVEYNSNWWRISVTCNSTLSSIYFYCTNNSAGQAVGTITIQDAQLEAGDIATDYIPTTTSAVSVGPLANIPRLNYGSDGCPSLLLEPQRTNLFTNSEDYSTDWSPNQLDINVNNVISPDGTQNADFIIENTTINPHFIFQTIGTTTISDYTISVFAKHNSRILQIFAGGGDISANPYANFDLENGLFNNNGCNDAFIEDYGNGWYRCGIVVTSAVTSGFNPCFGLANTLGSSRAVAYAGDGTSGVYLWGAQLEAGSYPTSYIPTLGSAVTRLADACSKTGISSLIGQTEGTIFVEANVPSGFDGNNLLITASDGSTSNMIFINRDSGRAEYYIAAGGVEQAAFAMPTVLSTGVHKLAIAYKANDFAFYVDGVLVHSDTSGSVPACSSVNVGSYVANALPYNDGISQAIIFPTRLSNSDLARLTSL